MTRFIAHYGIHFVAPFIIGLLFYKKTWRKVSLILLAGIALDIDHLLADPIFDSNRCSIGYHPLHGFWPTVFYIILTVFPKTRMWGIAFLLHLVADSADCLLITLK